MLLYKKEKTRALTPKHRERSQMSKKTAEFTWKCVKGHMGTVAPGCPLELEVYEHAAQGLGAHIEISVQECPHCLAQALETISEDLDGCQQTDCETKGDGCKDCLPRQYREVAKLRDAACQHFGLPIYSPAPTPNNKPSGKDLILTGLSVHAT
jgi:hypothetical protein